MKKKKILFISSQSIHTKKFIDMLKDDFEIYLITNNQKIYDDSKVKKVYIWKKNKIKNVFYTFKVLKEVKPDLINVQQINQLAFFYVFLLRSKYKMLLTAWGSDLMLFPYKNFVNMWMTRFSLKKATYLSSIDSVGMMSVMKCLSNFDKKIIPINFGISEYIEFEEDFSKKENIIFSPRNHTDLYNIENIIYSFAKFIKHESEWKLYISGSEDSINTPKYKKLVKTLCIEDNTKFLGHLSQEENSKIMKKAKVVVSVPLSDGRPVSVMEAIASNCIVICSDILANRELISNGINGIIVDHTKPFNLNVYKDIDINLQTKFNYKVSREFQYENAKKSYINLCKGLLNDFNHR